MRFGTFTLHCRIGGLSLFTQSFRNPREHLESFVSGCDVVGIKEAGGRLSLTCNYSTGIKLKVNQVEPEPLSLSLFPLRASRVVQSLCADCRDGGEFIVSRPETNACFHRRPNRISALNDAVFSMASLGLARPQDASVSLA